MPVVTSQNLRLLASTVIFQLLCLVECNYFVNIKQNGPIVQGGTITFVADVFASDGSRPQGSFKFGWKDNTLGPHTWTEETSHPRSTWNVTYPASKFYPGEYEVQVNVDFYEVIFWIEKCSKRKAFNITARFNGEMDLIQNVTRDKFVSNAAQVQHQINLSKADHEFLMKATEVSVYWFVDCTLYGQTEDLTFNYTYGALGANHTVEALVVASFEPRTTTTTTTSTTTSTTTTSTTTTSTTTTSTTTSSTTSTTAMTPTTTSTTPLPRTSESPLSSNNASNVFSVNQQGLGSFNISHLGLPYVCLNDTIIPPDPKKTYGYFRKQFSVKAPVQSISIKGTDWLQQYNLLDLQVSCNGSGNFKVCNYKEDANYNVTGDETCPQETILDTCQFNCSKFFSYENYTVIVIISNDVSKVVHPISVILYKVQKHAQLSVIVVPVVCSLVAVIMVVFGVAYYIQRRKRFTVEVADFDFGHGVGDMEYKTFRERLREAVVNSFNRDFGVDGEGNVWSPSRKYGSMQ